MFSKGASNYGTDYISRKYSCRLCAFAHALPPLARWCVFVLLPYQFLCCSSSTSRCHHLYWTGRKFRVRHLDTTAGTSDQLQGTNTPTKPLCLHFKITYQQECWDAQICYEFIQEQKFVPPLVSGFNRKITSLNAVFPWKEIENLRCKCTA